MSRFDDVGICEWIDQGWVGSQRRYPTKTAFGQALCDEGIADVASVQDIVPVKVRACHCANWEFDGLHYHTVPRFDLPGRYRGLIEAWAFPAREFTREDLS